MGLGPRYRPKGLFLQNPSDHFFSPGKTARHTSLLKSRNSNRLPDGFAPQIPKSRLAIAGRDFCRLFAGLTRVRSSSNFALSRQLGHTGKDNAVLPRK
jgi:hypothetical protein